MDGMLSQEEINALLGSMGSDDGDSAKTSDEASKPVSQSVEEISLQECDALGEISNIIMGTAATTLSILVNNRVVITTPQISYVTVDDLTAHYDAPCVFIYISYQSGFQGKNILILKELDVKVITDLMMGGDGTNTDAELSDLHLSAICEAMNQMMGSAATSMSSMINEMVDISPPVASLVDLNDMMADELQDMRGKTYVQVSFKMEIGNLVDSQIIQLYPIEFAKDIFKKFSISSEGEQETAPAPVEKTTTRKSTVEKPAAATQEVPAQPSMMQQGMQPNMGMPNMQQMGMANMQMGMQQPMNGMPGYGMPAQDLNIQPAQFQSFSPGNMNLDGIAPENIDLIMDVPLEVTVELGRTSKSIRDILDFAPGTIIELNKLAGEPIDVLVNGKFVAKGEVVVIEESFGIRVTEIVKD